MCLVAALPSEMIAWGSFIYGRAWPRSTWPVSMASWVWPVAPPPGKEGHNVDHICLRIEPFDPEDLRVHFLNHGIDLGAVHHNFGAEGYGSALYLKDPEGNSIELKGPSVQRSGRDNA